MGNPSGSPAEDSGGSGGTPPPPGSAPSAEEEEPSPDPTTGLVPGEDPSPDMIPVDELDRLFPNLPPDPGEEGKQTLEGIDADGDEVRDDVQRAIYRLEPRDEHKRRAMLQYARGLQQKMLARGSKETYLQASERSFINILCMREVNGALASFRPEPVREARITIEIVNYIFYNTEARVLANFEAEALIPSGAYPLPVSPYQATGFCE